ncbi:hypothetical protein D9758_007675 [Tetrapyrgos nigripes]|uniref:Zn(2)-C6 fungal-type domain-containing protein n=1 Tax=Tetrapyrgos nigripes TaxID=182062 RepID=A0A8H5LIM7_9AGAR|nr:hypothetical protein D9758_007675 [Tetrapyrgos nigripes]
MLKKDDRYQQMVYYQAGIGTYTAPQTATPFMTKFSKALDEAVAWNLHAHVMGGYEFLMQNYLAGDRICLFGFSRGAYTARSLAGMIHKVGILPACNHQQVPFAYKMFTRTDELGWAQSNAPNSFKKTFSIDVDIEFVGVWDTVNSVGLIPKRLPFTTSNTIIRTFRHAVSLDERRAKFKANLWNRPAEGEKGLGTKAVQAAQPDVHKPDHGQSGDPNHDHHKHKRTHSQLAMERMYSRDHSVQTDIEEVWFSGCHCDIGGGSVGNEVTSTLARIPLRWMVRECFKTCTGIMFHREALQEIGLDPDSLYPIVKPRPPPLPLGDARIRGIPKDVPKPRTLEEEESITRVTSETVIPDPKNEEELDLEDAMAPIYDQLSLSKIWWILELLPLRHKYQKGDNSWVSSFGANMGYGRIIPKQKVRGVKVHRTVKMRLEAEAENGVKYVPKANLLLEHAIWGGAERWDQKMSGCEFWKVTSAEKKSLDSEMGIWEGPGLGLKVARYKLRMEENGGGAADRSGWTLPEVHVWAPGFSSSSKTSSALHCHDPASFKSPDNHRFTAYQETAAGAGHGQLQYHYEYAGGGPLSGATSQIPVTSSSQSHLTSSRSQKQPTDDSNPAPKPKAKRRKVNHACLYCRRSHMTCDEGRPCQRCIKREIGHLCHDEPRTMQGNEHQVNPTSQGHKQGQGQDPRQELAQRPASVGGWGTGPLSSTTSMNDGLGSGLTSVSRDLAAYPQQQSETTSSFQQEQWIPPYRPGTFGTELAVLTEILENIDRAAAFDATGGILTSETQGLTRQGSFYSTSAYSELSQSQPFFAPPPQHHPRPQGPGHAHTGTGQVQTQAELQTQPHAQAQTQTTNSNSPSSQVHMGPSIATFTVQNQYPPSNPIPNPTRNNLNANTNTNTNHNSVVTKDLHSGALIGDSVLTPAATTSAMADSPVSVSPATSASVVTPGSTGRPTASPGLERNVVVAGAGASSNHNRRKRSTSGTQFVASPISTSSASASASAPILAQSPSQPQPHSSSSLPAPTPPSGPSESATSSAHAHTQPQAVASEDRPNPPPSNSSTPSITAIPFSQPNVSTSSINRFLLTAANQESGSREDRLARVIRSKYEAGLLKPYNYVKGYARLSRWMEGNVSQESKARVLMPLSVLRPKFRAVAQSLRPLDLVFIEEAFERLLLDYDRVFASMGVPACLWRRTGEIYKGNREFSELVGLDGYLLREGKVCIYELMAEESAVNYWEKYGTVAFDSSQKAVLTSCVLRYKPKLDSFASFNTNSRNSGGKDRYTTPNTYGSYSTYPAPMMPPTTVLARTGMTRKLWDSDSGSGDSSTDSGTGIDPGNGGVALPADEAAGAPHVSREQREWEREQDGTLVPVPAEEGLISCCFSFTIRRDKWGIPSMIVGNFVRC